jgi:hypothetical protein
MFSTLWLRFEELQSSLAAPFFPIQKSLEELAKPKGSPYVSVPFVPLRVPPSSSCRR